MAVEAMKHGAADFLEKPVRAQDLVDRVQQCLRVDREAADRRANVDEQRSLYESLTPRERTIVGMVAGGLASKQIAAELGVSTQAIDAHRGRAMRKLHLDNVPDLVRLLQSIEVEDADGPS